MLDSASATKPDSMADIKPETEKQRERRQFLHAHQSPTFDEFLETTAINGCQAPSAEDLEAFVDDTADTNNPYFTPRDQRPASPVPFTAESPNTSGAASDYPDPVRTCQSKEQPALLTSGTSAPSAKGLRRGFLN